jgi:hypothetical protein
MEFSVSVLGSGTITSASAVPLTTIGLCPLPRWVNSTNARTPSPDGARHAAKGARHPEQRASLVERHRIEVDKPGRQSHVVGFTFVEIGGGELPLPAMSA